MKFGPGSLTKKGGMGMCGPEDPPFHASPVVRKGPISSKNVSSKDPLLRKFRDFSLYSLNFCSTFSFQARIYVSSLQIWNFFQFKLLNLETVSPQAPNLEIFSSQAPSLSEANISSQTPHFGNPGCTPLPEKYVNPPPGVLNILTSAM